MLCLSLLLCVGLGVLTLTFSFQHDTHRSISQELACWLQVVFLFLFLFLFFACAMSTTQPLRRRGKTDGVALAKAGGRANGSTKNKTLQKLQKPKKGTEQKQNADGAAAAAAAAPPPPPPKPSALYSIWKSSAFVRLSIRLSVFILFAFLCVDIRLFAVRTYGRVIHEFDPWFNFRATQYYAEHGWEAFSTWFDTKR